jgi:mRNA interferase MazF
MATGYLPDRGDLIHLDFSPASGREIRDPRYALVLSTRQFSRVTGKALVCPITATIRGWPFEVLLEAGSLPRKKGQTQDAPSAILCDQSRTIDYAARAVVRTGAAPEHVVYEVTQKVLAIVDPAVEDRSN